MGVIVNKNNSNDNELSRRIEADLQNRATSGLDGVGSSASDYVEGSEYVSELKKTGRFGWVWVVLIVLAIISLISIIFL